MKKLKMLKKLHRTERILWVALLICLFLLFKFGVDISYEHIKSVWIYVLNNIVMVLSITVCMLQGLVIIKIKEYESEVFNNER